MWKSQQICEGDRKLRDGAELKRKSEDMRAGSSWVMGFCLQGAMCHMKLVRMKQLL